MKRLLAVMCVMLTIACSKCGKAQSAAVEPVERVFPATAVAVVVVPSVTQLGAKLSILENLKIAAFLAPLQGFADAHAFTNSLIDQLGIDIRSEDVMAKAGLDSTRSMGAAVLLSGQTVLALPVKDAAKLHTTLENLSYRRLGAGAGAEQKIGEVTLKTFSLQQGQPPRLAYVITHGYALVATDDGIAKLEPMATLRDIDSMAGDEAFKAALARNPDRGDVYGYVPPSSVVIARYPFNGALVTATLKPTAFTVAIDAPWKGEAQTLAFLTPQPGVDLVNELPRSSFAVARYSGDPAQLAPVISEIVGPYLQRAFSETGFDLKTQVLDRLKPGVVASLSLAPRPPMAAGMPAFDIRQTNPFTYAHLAGMAEAKSAEGLVTTLEQVAAAAPKFGANMKKIERNGNVVFGTTYSQGEGVHFGIRESRVMFGSPMAKLDEVMAPSGSTQPPVNGLTADAVSAVVDLQKLSTSVRALPADAWGLGGFAMKATTIRWLDATDDLKAIVVSAGSKDGNVHAQVSLTLVPKAVEQVK